MNYPNRLFCCFIFFVLTFVTVFTIEERVSAHALGQSYVFLHIDDELISGRFEMIVADANVVLNLDLPTDGTARQEQVEPHMERFRAYLLERVAMAGPDGSTPIRLGEHRLGDIDFAQFVVVEFELYRFETPPDFLDIQYSVLFDVIPDHQGLVVVEHNWRTGTFNDEANVALIFSANDVDQRLDLTSSSIWTGAVALFELGVHHIWVGTDHILFLLALLLPTVLIRRSGKWIPVEGFRTAALQALKIVTVFAVAHSVTIWLAGLNVVELPSRLVESIIAVSIAVVALDIVLPVFHSRMWLVVFGLGLFHGFGFAEVLGTMRIPSKFMGLSLFAFNTGIEVGQAVIVVLIFLVLFWLRRWKGYAFPVVQLAALGLAFVSIYWFIERAFELDLPLGSLVFGILGIK